MHVLTDYDILAMWTFWKSNSFSPLLGGPAASLGMAVAAAMHIKVEVATYSELGSMSAYHVYVCIATTVVP